MEEKKSGALADTEYTPPLPQATALGVQHVLAMFVGNVTVPFIIALVLGSSPEQRALLIQAALLVSGISTLIQTVGLGPFGARLPVVQGTSFGFVPVLAALAGKGGLGLVFGSVMVAGVVQIFLGFTLKWIRHWFPPLVSGLVVLAIGLALLRTGLTYAAGGQGLLNGAIAGRAEFGGLWGFGGMGHLLLASMVVFVTLILRFVVEGFFSRIAIFLGLVIGYLVAIPLGQVNFGIVANAKLVSLPSFLDFGSLQIAWVGVFLMVIMAIVTTVETVGDISGITIGGANREPTSKELRGGILADGLGTLIAPFLNAFPNTSYSQNVGLVALTGVMSRHVVTIGAIFLIILGSFPVVAALVAVTPQAVLGGSSVIMFGMVVAAGMRLVARQPFTTRNLTVIAVSLSLGLGLQQMVQAIPQASVSAVFPAWLEIFLEAGLAVTALTAIVLNAVLPKTSADTERVVDESAPGA